MRTLNQIRWEREFFSTPPVRRDHRWKWILEKLYRTRDPAPPTPAPKPYNPTADLHRWIESIARNGFNHGKATSPRTQRINPPHWMHSRPRSWTSAKRAAHRIERRTLKHLLANEDRWLEAETYRRCINKYDLV